MLSVLPPYDLTESKDNGVIWGDIEAFMESFESGAEAREWDRLCAQHLSISDFDLRGMFGHGLTLPGCV